MFGIGTYSSCSTFDSRTITHTENVLYHPPSIMHPFPLPVSVPPLRVRVVSPPSLSGPIAPDNGGKHPELFNELRPLILDVEMNKKEDDNNVGSAEKNKSWHDLFPSCGICLHYVMCITLCGSCSRRSVVRRCFRVISMVSCFLLSH